MGRECRGAKLGSVPPRCLAASSNPTDADYKTIAIYVKNAAVKWGGRREP